MSNCASKSGTQFFLNQYLEIISAKMNSCLKRNFKSVLVRRDEGTAPPPLRTSLLAIPLLSKKWSPPLRKVLKWRPSIHRFLCNNTENKKKASYHYDGHILSHRCLWKIRSRVSYAMLQNIGDSFLIIF